MEKTQSLAALFVLGAGLSTNSLGWALTGFNENKPAQLIRCGARVFDAGTDSGIVPGAEESRNLKRRPMRFERQTARRARR